MPYSASNHFNHISHRASQFYDWELAEFLMRAKPVEGKPVEIGLAFDVQGDNGERYTAELKKLDGGKAIVLDATLRRSGMVYKTSMTALRVQDDLYQITELTFDNRKEKLDARWEITKVLAHIGEEQLKQGEAGKLAEPHKEKGKFGKVARFIDRLMPNEPIIMPPHF